MAIDDRIEDGVKPQFDVIRINTVEAEKLKKHYRKVIDKLPDEIDSFYAGLERRLKKKLDDLVRSHRDSEKYADLAICDRERIRPFLQKSLSCTKEEEVASFSKDIKFYYITERFSYDKNRLKKICATEMISRCVKDGDQRIKDILADHATRYYVCAGYNLNEMDRFCERVCHTGNGEAMRNTCYVFSFGLAPRICDRTHRPEKGVVTLQKEFDEKVSSMKEEALAKIYKILDGG